MPHQESLTNGKCFRRAQAVWPDVMAAAEGSQQTAMLQEDLHCPVLDQPAGRWPYARIPGPQQIMQALFEWLQGLPE